MAKKFPFLPFETGLAHLTRSLAIAEELDKNGHEVIFCITKNKYKLVKDHRLKYEFISPQLEDAPFTNIKRFKNTQFLKPFIEEEESMIDKYKPDAVIIDFRFSSLAAAINKNIPIYFITQSSTLPYETHIPNPGYHPQLNRLLQACFKKFILNYKVSFYKTALSKSEKTFSETLNNIKFIVPETPSYLPLKNQRKNVYYVGPIFWNKFELDKPNWLGKMDHDKKIVYLTFGGTGYNEEMIKDISSALSSLGFSVIISKSNILKNVKKLNNIYCEKYLPGLEVCKKADIVICHGGYGTLMQALKAKKPLVIIPFNPDQLVHAMRLQEMGLAKVAGNFKLKNIISLNWENFHKTASKTPINKIIKAIEGFEKSKIDKTKYENLFYKNNGASKAAKIISAEAKS